jgi:hypothetical protein
MAKATILIAMTALGLATAAHAQQAAPAAPTCPASSYAKPWYGQFGDNDGVLRGYEVVSPCISPELREAATAIGMGRFKPLGVKNISTARFQATGNLANEAGQVEAIDKLDFAINYVIPAGRLVVDKTVKGRPAKEVRAFAYKQSWNETAPGVGGVLDPKALPRRSPLLKLTPYGALWSVIEAEGKAVVSRDKAGLTVITGTSPYDGYKVAVTLDAKNLPIAARVEAEGHVYTATFEGYSDRWESPYLFIFPSHMVWTDNGKLMANLTTTAFHSNPYVVFPPPTTEARAVK